MVPRACMDSWVTEYNPELENIDVAAEQLRLSLPGMV
eukprot:CAMPEP_0178663388 /NCGR_PEP_ID=MMETSP0698-20121128/28795_1 /TAXON_ID=265572 /ORGANISM="Extubocellulus spinifer, Strain CCMP396" /LENGTH=36 /DNA_ID= /DNA_START= /DNA_END= /DNA_ORIENTATION=